MPQNNKIFFSLICCCLFVGNLWAQSHKQEYRFVSLKDGISKVAVTTIVQDRNGLIWMGTYGNGLIRYDGIDHVYYKHKLNDPNSISSSVILCSKLDSKNRIWIGTENGLNLYNHSLNQFKKIPLGNLKHSNAYINSIEEDNLGNLYIGTNAHGLFKLHSESLKVEKVTNSNSNNDSVVIQINSIRSAASGRVFVGTNIGLKEVDIESNTLVNSVFLGDKNNPTINSAIQSLLIDTKNNLWVGTFSNGVFKLTTVSGKPKEKLNYEHFPISNFKIRSMTELEDKSFLFGTENDGLFNLSASGEVIKKYLFNKKDENSIRSNSIWSLFVDNNQRIWMGYYNKGVAVSDKLYDKFMNLESFFNNPNSLNYSGAIGLVKDKSGRLWIGMDGGGIDVYDPKSDNYNHINKKDTDFISGLTSDYIESIFIDSKENIWAGSWDSGLFLLKKGEKRFINFNTQNTNGKLASNTILSIDEGSDGIIWIGTFYKGLHSYNPSTNEFKFHNTKPFVENNITTCDVRKVLVDSEGTIWLGTTIGLYRIRKQQNGEFSILSMGKRMVADYHNQISANHILSLYMGTDNYLWIGTRGAGLYKYDLKKDKITWYNKLSGFNEENVSAILQSNDGNLWVSGNEGITKFNYNTNRITNYTINDGLLSNDFNYNSALKDEEGILYFGSFNGVDFFNPNDININKREPSLYLTGFKLFNNELLPGQKNSPLKKVIAETKSITLNHDQFAFAIDYVGINYTRPEKNQYAYYLEGLEDTWNYVGNLRSANYTNLNYGEYVFKLKAANNDGIWNEEPISLKINILPPWWKTKGAMFVYTGLLFMSLYLLNIITQNRIREKQLIENEREKRKQVEELNEKKFQFFTNISHEFRTPLTLILNPLSNLLNDNSIDLPRGVQEKHKIIAKNANRLSRLIDELLDFRRLELNKLKVRAKKINLVDFTKDIVSYFLQEASQRNIYLNVDADIKDIDVWADESMLEKIVFNILSNAFKATPQGGAINVSISMKNNDGSLESENGLEIKEYVEINISDTGAGLEPDQLKKIFERFYQVDSLNKAYYGGTGIGLEVVQSFVKLHKGKVEVESEIGKGTTFRVLLQAGNKHFSQEELLVENESQFYTKNEKPGDNVNLSELVNVREEKERNVKVDTLLIIEDNIELKEYLKNELKEDYKVILASNGKEGLKLAFENLPDVIIADIIMPEMDGLDFCKNIKNDIRTSHIPILVLSALSKLDDRIESIEFGADAYMSKPFDLRLVKLRLAQLVKSRKLIFDKYFRAISGTQENEKTSSIDKLFIQKMLNYINDNMNDSNLSVEILASHLNLSRSQLYRKVKTLTGQTVNELLRNIRLQRAKQILEKGSANISEVCFLVGFASPSYFTKCFKAHFGILPTEIEVKDV